MGALAQAPADDILIGSKIFSEYKGSQIVPVEVKAEENLRAKSLRFFLEKNPKLQAVRFSMSDYRNQDRFENVPYLLLIYRF